MKIKLLDITINASVSKDEEDKFKTELMQLENISDNQLLDDIVLLNYKLKHLEYVKSFHKDSVKRLAIVLYNVSLSKEGLPCSYIRHVFDIDKKHDGGIIISERE